MVEHAIQQKLAEIQAARVAAGDMSDFERCSECGRELTKRSRSRAGCCRPCNERKGLYFSPTISTQKESHSER